MASKVAQAIKDEETRQAEAEWRKSIIAELARLTAVITKVDAIVSTQADAPKRGK